MQALEKAILAQRSNLAAAKANLARLQELQGYRLVKAPFDGVITLRNVDVGALVSTGNTLLYRIAQTGTLRTYVNVPQTNVELGACRPGGDADGFSSSGTQLSRQRWRAWRTRSIRPPAPCSSKLMCRTQTARCFRARTPKWT